MADFIATARVRVQPDLTGFRTQLREQVKAATAKPIPVAVTPVITGFRAAIQSQLRKTPIQIPITPSSIRGFRADIRKQVEAVKVPVVPDITGFREQLIEKVAIAKQGVFVDVPVVTGTTVGTSAMLAGLTAQLRDLAAVQENVATETTRRSSAMTRGARADDLSKKAADNLRGAQLAFRGALRKRITEEERSLFLKTATKKGEDAYKQALEATTLSETAANKQLLRRAEAFNSKRAAQVLGIAAEKASATASQKTAAAEAAVGAVRDKNAKLLKTEIAQIATTEELKNREIAIRNLARNAAAAEAVAIDANAGALAAEARAIVVNAEEQLAAIGVREAAIASLVAQENELRKARIAADREASRAAAAGASRVRFAKRGAEATGLSLLGIRGATLAANSAFLAGAAAVTLFALAVRSAANLEEELNVFAETAGATANEMARVREVSEELGRDIRLPGISAADAAQSMTLLAKAGLSVEDSIAGATGVLQLAIAANIDLARSGEIVASALNAFGLAGSDAVEVADVLANAANAAQGSIEDMGIAFQQASAVGRQAGISFQDTATFLTILAKAGLRGSDAGTSLRTGLIRLINPTDKAADILKELGVSIRDAEGNIRPEVFQNLAAATANMSKQQRDQTIAQLAGNDAVRAFSIAMRLSLKDFLAYRAQLRQQGTAAALTEARSKGLAGAARGLASELQTIGLEIGRSVTPGLTRFVTGLSAGALAISQNEQVTETLRDTLTATGDGFQLLGSILSTVAPVALTAASNLQQVVSAIGVTEILAAVAAFKLFRPAATVAAAAFGPLQALVLGLTSSFGAFRAAGLTATASVSAALQTSLRAALASSGAALASFLFSVQGLIIATAILAAGLVFLATRASSSERAIASLSKANDALAASINRANTAAAGVRGARRDVQQDRLAVQTARLAEAQARQALASSNAARGSLERRQLENSLAIAIQNVTFATEDYDAALRSLHERQEENRAAETALNEERNKTAARVQGIVALVDKQLTQAKKGISTPIAESPTALSDLELEALARERLIKLIREEANEAIKSTDAAERAVGRRQALLANLIKTQEEVPRQFEIQAFITAPNLRSALEGIAEEFGITGKTAVETFVQGWLLAMGVSTPKITRAIVDAHEKSKRPVHQSGREVGDTFVGGLLDAIREREAEIAAGIERTIRRSQGRLRGLERQADILTIAGAGAGAIEANLRARFAEAGRTRAALERKRARQGGRLGTADQQALSQAISDQASIAAELRANAEAAARDVEAEANKIKDARDKADQAIIDAFTREETRLEGLLTRAGRTDPLRDDILFNKKLLDHYNDLIKSGLKSIKDLETRRDALATLYSKRRSVIDEIRALQKQQREDLQARIREGLELDIQFFSTRENVAGEIRARQRLIRHLQRLQDATKKGTVEYKRLRNEIAEQEAAIRDLKDQVKDRSDAFAELSFEFLQAQQGFAANLFGNLLPMGSTAGLVGNVSPTGGVPTGGVAGEPPIKLPHGAAVATGPQGPLTRATAAATTRRGSARAQANTEIEVLRQILLVLNKIEQRDGHPESRRSKIHLSNRSEGLPHGV